MNNNKLTPENIDNILNTYIERKDIKHFSACAKQQIAEQDYNLCFHYVEQADTRGKIDIAALNAEIKEIVARQQVLREEIDKIIEEIEVGK